MLGLEVPLIRMPVAPGRNIALLVEVAARNQLLKHRGYDAARRAVGAGGRARSAARPSPAPARARTLPAGAGHEAGGAPTARRRQPRVLVITGLSGSGKTHVARALEDVGLVLRRQPADRAHPAASPS